MNTLTFTVCVTAQVSDDVLDFDDREVAGQYTIELPQESRAWTSSRQAGAVLDQFHGSVAIAVLDDFDIAVITPQGEQIYEDEE